MRKSKTKPTTQPHTNWAKGVFAPVKYRHPGGRSVRSRQEWRGGQGNEAPVLLVTSIMRQVAVAERGGVGSKGEPQMRCRVV